MTNSYSSLATFEQCPYKYKLIYLDKHFIDSSSIATDFGTLVHSVEEKIGNYIKENKKINYDLLKNDFKIQIEKLKNKYPKEFFTLDKSNRTYEDKANYYLNIAIYRLEKRLKKYSNLKIISLEKEFFVKFNKHLIHGFIDRILYDKLTDTYIIEDIKTYSKPLTKKDLETSLQHVIYTLALKVNGVNNIICDYDLPLCDIIQTVDTNYFKKGLDQLSDIFDNIKMSDFHPNPTPLCHWCIFSETYVDQPEEAKGLCPYCLLWTKENKSFKTKYKRINLTKHQNILEEYKKTLK